MPNQKLTKLQQEQVRSAIKTTQLVKRLQFYALGQVDPSNRSEDPQPVELDAGKLRAIEILLKKSLPDLSSVNIEGSGKDGALVFQQIGLVGVASENSKD